jgi:hypothetical protein
MPTAKALVPMSTMKNDYELSRNAEEKAARFKSLCKFKDPQLITDLSEGYTFARGFKAGKANPLWYVYRGR